MGYFGGAAEGDEGRVGVDVGDYFVESLWGVGEGAAGGEGLRAW